MLTIHMPSDSPMSRVLECLPIPVAPELVSQVDFMVFSVTEGRLTFNPVHDVSIDSWEVNGSEQKISNINNYDISTANKIIILFP